MFLIEDDSGNDLNILSIESQLNQLWLIYIIYTMDQYEAFKKSTAIMKPSLRCTK